MPRRRTPEPTPPTGGGAELVLPADLTFRRPGDSRTSIQWHADQRAWLRAHGVDPSDQQAAMRVSVASRRAHAVTVSELSARDRVRRRAEGAGPDDPA